MSAGRYVVVVLCSGDGTVDAGVRVSAIHFYTKTAAREACKLLNQYAGVRWAEMFYDGDDQP